MARDHWLMGLLEEEREQSVWARGNGREHSVRDNGRDYWLPGVAEWDRARDPPVERSMLARGEYEAVQRPGVVGAGKGKKEDKTKGKGKKEMFAVGSEYRAGLKAGNVPRVELYDAQLHDVRAGAGGYEYALPGAYDHYSYDFPPQGAYLPSAYEAVPRDAMGYDSGLVYTHDPHYGYDARYDAGPGYDYSGHYGGSYVPRQVPLPVWAPQHQPQPQQQQQHRSSGGCILS